MAGFSPVIITLRSAVLVIFTGPNDMKKTLQSFVPTSTFAAFALAFLALVFAPAAGAQWYPFSLFTGTTIAGSTTNTTAWRTMETRQVDEFALQVVAKLAAGAETANMTLTMGKSVDGVNYETAFTAAKALSGTNLVSWQTNVNAQQFPFWKVVSLQNAATNTLTNIVVTWGWKTGLRKYQ